MHRFFISANLHRGDGVKHRDDGLLERGILGLANSYLHSCI